MGGGYPNTELRSLTDIRVFEFFDFLILGGIVTAVGVIYFSTIGYNLLPINQDALENPIHNPSEYILETKILYITD